MSSKTGRIIFGFALVLIGLWWIYVSREPRIQIEQRHIQVAELDRTYRLVKPLDVPSGKKLPLMIALPGALDTAEQMASYTQLDRVAARQQFVLAYLEGRNYNWPPSIPEENPDVYQPDIAMFDAVCDQLIKEVADPQRVYLVGVSQGGCMANVLAMKQSGRLAAAVINCGWVPKPLELVPPMTEHKMPMLFIGGSEDKQVDPEIVRIGAEIFKMAGHPVRFEVIRGAGHGWNANYGVNDMVWGFLHDKEHRQASKE
jgi:poly(3-hydroxybutyrate) depolymerase